MDMDTLENTKNTAPTEDTSDKGIKNDVGEKIEVFVRAYVTEFEKKLGEYAKEAAVCDIDETGRMSYPLAAISGSALAGASVGAILLGRPMAYIGLAIGGLVIGIVRATINSRKQRNKIEEITEMFQKVKSNELKKIFVEAAGSIFHSFQSQFIHTSDEEDDWRHYLKELAIEACSRSISYIYNEEEMFVNAALSKDLLTKAFIKGNSNENYILKKSLTPTKIQQININKLYDNIGLKIVGRNGRMKYYKKKIIGYDFGYRWAFNWEKVDTSWISNYEAVYHGEIKDYNTLVNHKELEAKLNQILADISKEDSKFKFVRIEHIFDSNIKKIEMVKALQKMRIGDIMLAKHAVDEGLSKIELKDERIRIFAKKKISKEFVGCKRQLAELYDTIQMERKQVLVSQCASIRLESMGAFELTRKYGKFYENVLWIDAEDQSSARNAFHRLAEKLKISCERDFYCIVEDIYKHFCKSKSLFVFDNVNHFRDIIHFLPSNLSPTDGKLAIIIISSNRNLKIGDKPNINVFKLEEFTPEKSLRFLNMVLDIKDEEKSDDSLIAKLSKQLSFFPLAFCQAVSQIKTKGSLDSAISIYLVEFCNEKKKRFSVVKESKRDRYTETAYITWQITIRNIERNEMEGPLAILLVEIMAFLAADDIPVKAFTDLAVNEGTLMEGIDILLKFSLITVEENVAHIHRHDQQIIRMWLQDNKREAEVLRTALTSIHDNVGIKHRAALWTYASEYTTLIDDYFSRMDKESIAYPEFLDTLNYLVTDGDVLTIANIFDHLFLERRNDLWRKLICIIKRGYSVTSMENYHNTVNTEHKMFVKFLYLFHAEVYNALKHSNSNDLVLFLQNFVFIFFPKTLINSWFEDDTALHKSVRRGNLDVVKILIQNGANVNCLSRFEESPLYVALRAKNLKVAQYLLDQGADSQKVDQTNGWKAIHYAAYYGNLNLMQKLAKTKEECETRTEVDWTPLHFAALNDHVEIVEFLINYGIDLKALTEEGQTVCHIAAERGAIRVIKYLIDNRLIDVNVRTGTKETLLNTAVKYNQFDIVKYLLSDETHSKADINTFNVCGVTPLFQAVLKRNDHMANFLIEHGAVVDNDQNGNTLLGQLNISALHLAATFNCLEIVRIMIEETKADINMGLTTSFSPFQVAKYFDSTQVCEFLIRNGADTSEWSGANLENIRRIFRCFYKDINEYDAISYMINELNIILCMSVPYENNDNFRDRLKQVCSCLEKLKAQVGEYQK